MIQGRVEQAVKHAVQALMHLSGTSVTTPEMRQEVAKFLGLSAESVTEALTRLSHSGETTFHPNGPDGKPLAPDDDDLPF